MWPVSPPVMSAGDAAVACAEGTRDRALAMRLLRAMVDLERNNRSLRIAISTHRMHLIATSDYEVTGLSDEELDWLYTAQLAKPSRPARKAVYDEIMRAAPHGLCCYCQYGQAKTLDHFVPRDAVVSLAIDPWNLVPACAQCNHKLLASWGTTPREQMLHPYDMPDLGRWLFGNIVDRNPIRISFTLVPLAHHPADIHFRMRHEFDSLGLAEMFAVVSAGEIEIASGILTRNFPIGNPDEPRAHLEEMANDMFLFDVNSRRGVVYEALAADDWYCSGGYATRMP